MSAVVLTYHRLGAAAAGDPGVEVYTVPLEQFTTHLDAIDAAGCRVLPFDELADAWVAGRSLPARSVAITFDDGNASDVLHALPELARRRMRAAFFVTPAWIETPGFLSWAEVRELLSAGMTVGAHGLDHAPLAGLNDDGLRRQLRESRRLLEARLDRPVTFLALPGGAGGLRELRLAREEGYRVVASSVPRRCVPRAEQGLIPRFALRRDRGASRFRALIEQRPLELLRRRLRYEVLSLLRSGFGESAYQRLRRAWARRSTE